MVDKANNKRHRKRSLKINYGITIEEYNDIFISQNGCCKICGIHQSEMKKNLFVDHNHNTGEIRGLLCVKCNTGLGGFKDNTYLITRAIDYLKYSDTGKISSGKLAEENM